MNNNFQNINEDNYNEEEKKYKKFNIKRNILIFILLLMICFFSTYVIVNKLAKDKNNYVSDSESEVTMYDNTKELDDNMEIVLKNNGIIESSETLKDFKRNNDIEIVNEQFLLDYYISKGYKVESLSDKSVVLDKTSDEQVLAPNKYYLSEKEGYFAIYKTDENGKAFIEEESDVYTNSRKVNTIPEAYQEEIKNFKLQYDTKDEAKEILSGYIS